MNLTQMQQVLIANFKENASIFVRIGKSYIINRSCIFQISVQRQKLLLSDGENFSYTLDVSKEALKRLKEWFVVRLSQ
jgi:DNA-binding LytR/AlgR family response regulator